jgi:hypothetical protein
VELRGASDEFSGHCLALTLLGSYLTDAYNGDIRSRKEVSERLADDVRQGLHARNVMQSYQRWFGEGPELSVLRILGLFDRPADGKTLEAPMEEVTAPAVTCLIFVALSEWHFGEIASCKATIAEAIALARELNDTHALAVALWHAD